MNFILAQVVLAGPGDEGEGWMNILFIVVLAVFWVVGGIIKATSKKPQERQNQPPLNRRPIRKVPSQATANGPSSAHPTKTVQARPQPRPLSAMLGTNVEKALRPKFIEATRKLESRSPKSQVEPIIQDIPEINN